MTEERLDDLWVIANMVAGLDGAAAVGGRVGALSGPADQQLYRTLRADADVVLVGAGTVRAERYGPVRLSDDQMADRTDTGRPAVPPIAVVTRSLDLDPTIPLFAASREGFVPRPIVVTCADAPPDAREAAAEHAEVIVAGSATVDLAAALGDLRARGLSRVLTEGGPALLGELIDLDLLDELRLTLAPFVGGDPLPIATNVAPEGRALTRFDLADVHQIDGHVFLRYLTRRADRGS
jgi:riboflavin biosynthesis pyrimidine reductase